MTDETGVAEADGGDTALSDALHAMAQPLTALGFIVELALMQPDPEVHRQALKDAAVECRRAVKALEALRAAIKEEDAL